MIPRNLYLLRRTERGQNHAPDYDVNTGFVVRAINFKEARQLADSETGDEHGHGISRSNSGFWLDPKLTTLTKIGTSPRGRSEIVLRSFAAG